MKHLNLIWLILTMLCTSYSTLGQHTERDKIIAPSRGWDDHFGSEKAVAINGDFAVVGTGQSNINGSDAGAVFIYLRDSVSCEWLHHQTLLESSSNPNAVFDNNRFGSNVAMNENFLIVGAPQDDYDYNNANFKNNAGSVYIYELIGNTWTFMLEILPNSSDRVSNALFGRDVDLFDNMLIVGAPGENSNQGAAYIFEFNNSPTYTQITRLTASDGDSGDEFGYSVAMDSDWAVVGAHLDEDGDLVIPMPIVTGAGSAYVFMNNGSWSQVNKLESFNTTTGAFDRTSNDRFGYEVDIEGDFIMVTEFDDSEDITGSSSQYHYGSVHAFRYTGTWDHFQKIQEDFASPDGDWFGSGIALEGDRLVVGGFKNEWLTANANFGKAIETGAAFIFDFDGTTWNQTQKLHHSDRPAGFPTPLGPGWFDHFGSAVAIHMNRVIIGAEWEEENDDPIPTATVNGAGSAYLFEVLNPADLPELTATPDTICDGVPTLITLTIDPFISLNDAYEWEWTLDTNGVSFLTDTAYEIQYTVNTTTTFFVRGVGCGAPDGPWGQITIVGTNLNNWHQFTKFATGSDVVNDVITDDDGFVYVVGNFFEETTFHGGGSPDITITNTPDETGSFIAQYNPCGDLMWEAHSIGSLYNSGNSIVVDDGIVYIVGDFSQELTFTSSDANSVVNSNCLSQTIQAIPNQGVDGFSGGYIAAFEKSDGCLLELHEVKNDFFTRCTAVSVDDDPNGFGTVFVAGVASSSPFNAVNFTSQAYVHRYSPSNLAVNNQNFTINGATFGSSYSNNINDMDYDETNNLLWVIGDYELGMNFTISGQFVAAQPNNSKDAYIASFQNAGGMTLNSLEKGNSDTYMTGEGIDFDESIANGHVYWTGSYRTFMPITNPFNMGLSTLPSASPISAYVMGHNYGAGSTWANNGTVPGGRAIGKTVTARDGRAYFAGDYNSGAVVFPGFFTINHVNLTAFNHIYVFGISATGIPQWNNATADFSFDGEQNAESITTNTNNEAFTVGSYRGKLSFLNPVLSFPIISTSSAAGTNGIILRTELNTGALNFALNDYEKPDSDDPISATQALGINDETALDLKLKIYPNPTTHISKLVILGKANSNNAYTVSVYDAIGREVIHQLVNGNTVKLNLTGKENGVYVVKVSNTHQVMVTKLIKSE